MAANQSMAPASVATANTTLDDDKQIEVQIVNVRGEPQPNVRYELKLPDGTVKLGTSAADGYIRISGIRQTGQASLVLPEIDAAAKA